MDYGFQTTGINPAALQQSEHWYDAKGNLHRIENMSKFHAQRVLPKLFGAFGGRVMTTPLYQALQRRAQSR